MLHIISFISVGSFLTRKFRQQTPSDVGLALLKLRKIKLNERQIWLAFHSKDDSR